MADLSLLKCTKDCLHFVMSRVNVQFFYVHQVKDNQGINIAHYKWLNNSNFE